MQVNASFLKSYGPVVYLNLHPELRRLIISSGAANRSTIRLSED